VRSRAADALGKIGDEKAIPGLLKLLEDSESDVRSRAADALGKIGDEKAIPGLLKLVEHSESSVRWMAAYALGNIGDEKAIDRDYLNSLKIQSLLCVGWRQMP